jgi:hypothetical protein
MPSPPLPTRRAFLAAAGGIAVGASRASAAPDTDSEPAPPLAVLIRHPLCLRSLYRLAVGTTYAPDGAAGVNRDGYRFIEEQHQGGDWVLRGIAAGRPDWVELGWRMLDWGLARQQHDGGFGGGDAFHSTSFFIEALARACLLDPDGGALRREALARAARWEMRWDIETHGARGNAPFTHRRYILAAGFGQAAKATGERGFAERATSWAREGLALQQADGTNPERGGFDAGYQMVGVAMALRYLPVCADPALRAALRAMCRRAVPPELARLRPDGTIDGSGSTRILAEKSRDGRTKDVPYSVVFEGLVYGAQILPEPAWLEPAERIARARHWIKA